MGTTSASCRTAAATVHHRISAALALAVLLLCVAFDVPAQSANEVQAQLVVHLLDYVSVDYPSFVKDGKIVDAAEYEEQQEFAQQVSGLLAQLPQVRERPELLAAGARLRQRIDARAPGDEVARLATELRWHVIAAYNVAVVPKRAPDIARGAVRFSLGAANTPQQVDAFLAALKTLVQRLRGLTAIAA